MSGRRRSNRQNSNQVVDFEADASGSIPRMNAVEINEQPIKLNFADFENILRRFSGENTMSVRKWIAEFEQYAETFRLSEKQKFIFCKRSLCGAAKMYIEYEAKPINYYDLRNALYAEFLPKINSADVHNQLKERKKKSSESFREYLYIMIDIASQAEVDDASVISYVISGIQDHPSNKMILYGAKTMTEFKEKLLTYEKLKLESNTQAGERHRGTDQTRIKKRNDTRDTVVRKYCFNCGSKEHECYACPQKDKGPKCFRCSRFGHKSPNCPVGKTSDSGPSSHLIVKSGMYVPVKVNGYFIEALIDTGSDICVLKKGLLQFIKPKYICGTSHLTVTGLGANVTTEGSCLVEIEINQDVFENVELNLINNDYMKPDLILGIDFLQSAVVQIEGGKVKIHKKKEVTGKVDERKEEETLKSCFLAEIDVADEHANNLPDVSYLKENIKKKVLTLVKDYRPEVPAESPIKMKIVPIDERPVYQAPRRFPPREQKIIEEQVERLHSVVIATLTKLSLEDAGKWYSHLKILQRMLNSTFQRAIQMSPYELLTGTSMRTEKDIQLMQIIEEEYAKNYCEERDELRRRAKDEIAKIQRENQQQYNKKRKRATQYKVKDVVAIERTQFSTGLKIKPKFLGPYEVVRVKGHDRYVVEKIGSSEGPKITTTSADKMKYWSDGDYEEDILEDESNEDENNKDEDDDKENTEDNNTRINIEQGYSSGTEELSGTAECGTLNNNVTTKS